MEATLVSVITPAFNAAATIGETLRSALTQTHRDVEVLVADDCSTDDTRAIVTAMATRDPRVRLFPNTVNVGPAESRNASLLEAHGRYIAFLDADDLWMPTKLEKQLAVMRQTGAGMSYTAYRRITADGAIASPVIRVPDRIDYRAACRNTAMVTSTVLVDRAQTGHFSMPKTYYDDYACWLNLLRRGVMARAVDEELVHYRLRPGSVSRRKLYSAMKVWEVQRRVEGLALPVALLCFASYAFNAVKKYYFAR